MYFHKEFVFVVEINNLVVFDNNLRGSPLLSQALSVMMFYSPTLVLCF